MDNSGRGRAWRRAQAEKRQRRRHRRWKDWDWEIDDPTFYGMLRKTHFGCGCPLCKPWKWGALITYIVLSDGRVLYSCYKLPLKERLKWSDWVRWYDSEEQLATYRNV